MLIKEIYRKLRFGHKATSEDYVNYLNKNKALFSSFEEFATYCEEK